MSKADLGSNFSADRHQANVMLAYTLPEAETLLESKATAAKESLANCEEDLGFLREQITVSSNVCGYDIIWGVC